MAKNYWENNGEPLAEEGEHQGEYAATVDLEDGSPVSRYYGKTHKEVADQLLDAQLNASVTIKDQKRKLKDRPAKTAEPRSEYKPRELTNDERFSVAQDITDPVKGPQAIAKVVEAATGVPAAKIAERFNKDDAADRAQLEAQAAREFIEDTPEFYVCPKNITRIARYFELHNLAVTKENYQRAFDELSEDNLLVAKPATPATEINPATPAAQPASEAQPTAAEHTAPATRPRGAISTGLRNSEVGAGPQPRQKERLTVASIEAMSVHEYNDRLENEKGFEDLVNRVYAEARQQAAG